MLIHICVVCIYMFTRRKVNQACTPTKRMIITFNKYQEFAHKYFLTFFSS